jgi:MFS family permease
MRQLLGLFRSRNYRLYFSGQFISQIGNWMTQTATLWLVYQLTQSVFLVGVIGFATQIPTLIVSPVAGVWVDRLDRVRLLVVTQTLAALQSLALAAAVFAHVASFPVLVNLALIQGCVNAFDIPARQVLNGSLAERRADLAGIISLNSTLVNLGRMVGPALAGFVIAGAGAGFCFVLDAFSYVAAIGTVLALRLERPARPRTQSSVRKELGEGLTLALGHPQIRLLLLVAAAVSVFGLSVFTLLPAYAKQVFGGEGRTLGLLMSSFSSGAAVSGILLAGRRGRGDSGQVIGRGLALAGVMLVGFAYSKSLALSLGCLFLMGVGCVMVVASSNTLVQHLVAEEKRGRIMSLYGVAFQGGMPLGALFTGTLAEYVGLSGMSLVNGFACLGLTLLLFSRLFELDAALGGPLSDAGSAR